MAASKFSAIPRAIWRWRFFDWWGRWFDIRPSLLDVVGPVFEARRELELVVLVDVVDVAVELDVPAVVADALAVVAADDDAGVFLVSVMVVALAVFPEVCVVVEEDFEGRVDAFFFRDIVGHSCFTLV
jgi:hypothetical protein